MHTNRSALFLLWCAAAAVSPAGAHASDADVAASRAILDGWQGEAPEKGERRLHVIAWRVKDRGFPSDHQARLDRIMTHIQDFYRREMERHGFGPRTIRLDRDAAGKLVVHEVVGEGSWADYDGPDGQRIRTECVPALRAKGIDIDRETVMIFTNLAEWDQEKLVFRHKSPYYAGGDWRRGTAWQLDSPELDTTNLAAREPLVQDGQYGRISLGKHNSIFIGGIAHELGHALGLPHCRERPDEEVQGTALMGSGNRTYGDELRGEGKGSFLTLAHALRLAAHPQFSGSVKGLGIEPQGAFAELAVERAADGKSFRLTGRVSGEPPVYAVMGYLDPADGGDYDARTVSAVPDTEGRFALDCAARARANGRTAARRLPCQWGHDRPGRALRGRQGRHRRCRDDAGGVRSGTVSRDPFSRRASGGPRGGARRWAGGPVRRGRAPGPVAGSRDGRSRGHGGVRHHARTVSGEAGPGEGGLAESGL